MNISRIDIITATTINLVPLKKKQFITKLWSLCLLFTSLLAKIFSRKQEKYMCVVYLVTMSLSMMRNKIQTTSFCFLIWGNNSITWEQKDSLKRKIWLYLTIKNVYGKINLWKLTSWNFDEILFLTYNIIYQSTFIHKKTRHPIGG